MLKIMEETELTTFQEMTALLSIARMIAGIKIQLQDVFYRSRWIVEMDNPLPVIKIATDEGTSMGMEYSVEEELRIDKRITIMNDQPDDPMSGTWLMMYNFHEKTETLFYWQTKMLVLKYDMKPYQKAIQ